MTQQATLLGLHPQASESQLDPILGGLHPCSMPSLDGLRVGGLSWDDLLAAYPLLGGFVTKLGADVGGHLLHASSQHVSILALVARANGKNVAFKFLAGPYFRCLPRHGRIGTSASTSLATTTTSTVSTASRAASVRISTHVEWNPWILFSWDLYDPLFVLVEGSLGLSYKLFSQMNVSLERFCAHECLTSPANTTGSTFLAPDGFSTSIVHLCLRPLSSDLVA